MKKWKYNIRMALAIITGISFFTFNLYASTTIRTMLVEAVMSTTASNILIMATKGLTAYLGLSYLVCSSILIIYVAITSCLKINENKKFATEEKPDIDQVLDIYKKEKQSEKDKENNKEIALEKQTYTMKDIKKTNYTIEDLKKEKEKLECNQIVMETKEKQKVLD